MLFAALVNPTLIPIPYQIYQPKRAGNLPILANPPVNKQAQMFGNQIRKILWAVVRHTFFSVTCVSFSQQDKHRHRGALSFDDGISVAVHDECTYCFNRFR